MASSESDMASESTPPSLEELSTRGATALLVPWILGMATVTSSAAREVAVFVHQPTRSITLIEGSLDIEAILREIPSKEGHLPASKASIESLPLVQISEPGLECAICLTEYEVNGEVKEMPCKHKFHSDCIGRWLGIHGSCPVCRFSMPVDEKNESDERRGGDGLRIHVFFARAPNSDSETESGRGTDGSGPEDPELESGNEDGGDDGNDELPAQDMERDDSD